MKKLIAVFLTTLLALPAVAEEPPFTLELEHLGGYEFRRKFDWDALPPLTLKTESRPSMACGPRLAPIGDEPVRSVSSEARADVQYARMPRRPVMAESGLAPDRRGGGQLSLGKPAVLSSQGAH